MDRVDETGDVSDKFIEYILLSHQVVCVCCVRLVGMFSTVYILIYVVVPVRKQENRVGVSLYT
jgi:dolichyl-phosphate-mannose--protein O-mannosyl transferase